MIASVRGEVAHLGKDNVVVDVNGVGYQVYVSQRHLSELPNVGEAVKIFTHLVHREDAMLLFGFASLDERELFLLLNSVSGIGAKTALGVLSALSVSDVVTAVVGNAPARLAKAPGVGKKTAERIVLALREKLQEWQPVRSATPSARRAAVMANEPDEVEAALLALGYAEDEIAEALEAVGPSADVEDPLRRTLAHLSGF
jgi:Holliday junction DNA helicase RuvA